jgi:hypothetical protein
VKHFVDLMDSFTGPAATRWAALLYGAYLPAPNSFS